MLFSVIIPVWNRRAEVADLLESLLKQPDKEVFEVVVVDDGSTDPCGDIVESYKAKGLNARYFFKQNEGRSPARNYGIDHSSGEWLIFFDSDCVIPPGYFQKVENELRNRPDVFCYGGPDAAADNFTPLQKAINVAMTSPLTTGGIRGRKRSIGGNFIPRTFNMGFRREVYDKVGGFREMFSEDIDMSTRIRQAGFATTLLPDCPVWHKRRVSLKGFLRQTWVFGMSRITLNTLYPGSMKLVHTLPAVAVITALILVLLAIFVSPWWLLPMGLWIVLVWLAALAQSRSRRVSLLAIPASMVQIAGYGCGFIQASLRKFFNGGGRDEDLEIKLRKGK